jgi:DNA repair exonuclease SbcCD nuclease subunit
MRFIHFADCHLDGFRDYKLAKLGFANFKVVIQAALDKQVDFVLLAGDLFNTAIPRIEALKVATEELKKLQDAKIPVYAIAGSHDYSPNGKTVLDVLELAGLLTLVMKGEVTPEKKLRLEFTKDKKTGALITGIIGKKGMLDSAYYQSLDTNKLQGDGFKIFMFHTALEELKTKEFENMPGHSLSMLPSGFDYYAGGHVHVVQRYSDKNYQNIVYPGPTFPNSFRELELLKKGSYVLYDDEREEKYSHEFIETKKVLSYTFSVEGKSASEAKEYILKSVPESVQDAIVLLRIIGTLEQGTVQDMELDDIIKELHKRQAFHVLRNTAKLQSMTFEEEEYAHAQADIDTVEKETIEEHLNQIPLPELNEKETTEKLLHAFEIHQIDGETKSTFTSRVIDRVKDIIEE